MATFEELFGDVEQPKVTMDDARGLTEYGALDFIPETGKGIARGFLNLGAGVVGTADWLVETVSYPVYSLLSPEMKAKADRFNEFVFDERKRKIVASRKSLAADPENAAGWVGAVIGEALPYLAASMVGGAAGAAKAGAAGLSSAGTTLSAAAGAASVGFAVEGEMAYQSAIDGGATEGQANTERVIIGSVNAAIESLQALQVLKVGKEFAKVGKLKAAMRAKVLAKTGKTGALTADLLWEALGEGLEEGGQELTSLMVPALLRDDIKRKENGEVDWAAFGKQIGGSVIGGAVAGGVFGGAKILGSRIKTNKDPRAFNEYSLDQADEVVKTNRPLPKLTNQEKKYANRLVEVFGGTKKDARRVVASTAERRLAAPLSKQEKAQAVVMQMGDHNVQNLKDQTIGWHKKRKVSTEAVTDVLNWAHENGGVPSNPDFRNDFMYDMRTAVAIRERQIRKGQAMDLKGKESNKLNPFQAVRYALGDMSVASGHNLSTTWSRMNTLGNEAKNNTVKRMNKMYADVGVRPVDIHLTYKENQSLAEFLFAGDDTAIETLDQTKQDLAYQLRGLLQNEGKKAVTSIRWKMWNQHGIEPDSVKSKDRASVLAAGRKAEKDGKLEEWLGRQKWASREDYYMSDMAGVDMGDQYIESVTPTDVSKERKSRKPGTTPGEARSRKGNSEWRKGSVIDNIHRHLSKLNTSLAVMDEMSTFWKQFQDANPSKNDVASMKKFVDNMLGRRTTDEQVAEILRKSTGYFWRFHFYNPAKAAYFFTRNILQNAYMGSQMSTGEIFRAGKSLMLQVTSGQHNQDRVNSFNKHWENSISQKQQMTDQALMMETESSIGGASKKLLNKARYYADKWSSWAIKSDSYNRSLAWNMYWEGSNNTMTQYNRGEISWEKVQKRLKLNTLHYSQRLEMLKLADNPTAFNERYAEYKTENTHFRYQTTQRSAVEQSTISRALVGLMVYPRGVANLSYTNGFVPMMQGMKVGNWDQAYSGLKSVLALALGMVAARKALYEVTGRVSYGLMPEYSPLGPGLTIVADNIDRIGDIQQAYGSGEIDGKEAALRIVDQAADHIELVIPILDIYADLYEANNDQSGVSLARRLRSAVKDEYPNFTYQERSYWEKIAHVLWSGGFEEVNDE